MPGKGAGRRIGSALLAALASGPILTAAWAPANAQPQSPMVTATRPGDGETGVPRDIFIAADVFVPNGGIDPATLTSATASLRRVSDNQQVAAVLNTSGGGDVIVLRPVSLLASNTEYRFEVTEGLLDASGFAFIPFVMTFTTGTAMSGGGGSVAFAKVALTTPAGAAFTAVAIGPDGMLYGGVNDGEILRFPINPDGTLGPAQSIATLQTANGGNRLLIGLEFDPNATAGDLVLWATHSYFAFSGAPDWTGKMTRLTGPDLGTAVDVVVNLPRSTRDHVTNQLRFGPDGALYFLQGSNSAMGAPDAGWNNRPERLLTAAVLRLDTGAVAPPLDVKTQDGGTYDPFAPGAPLTIHATGVRNAYDLLWHRNGSLYVPTNGSAAGGATPASPNPVFCDHRIDQALHGDYTGPVVPGIASVTQTQRDWLFRVVAGGYYGHPNPLRCEWVLNGGNPTSGTDPAQVNQYATGTLPDRNWRGAAFDFGLNQSPDGIIEYKSGAFGGALAGRILVARFSGGDDIMIMTPGSAGEIIDTDTGNAGMTGFLNPLDLVEDQATGRIYVSEYGDQATTAGAKMTLLRPVPGPCTGLAPPDPLQLSVTAGEGGAAVLAWDAVATATSYDLVTGDVAALYAAAGDFAAATQACLGNELTTTIRQDATPLAEGGIAWYLVRAANCASAGSYDSGSSAQQASRDTGIAAAAGSCP